MTVKFLKAKDVAERTSVSTAQIHRMVKAGRFPSPIKITDHRTGWVEEEVDQWISDCVSRNRMIA